jgi:hypothetical protein
MPAAIYTADLADAVLCGLRAGRTLYDICRDPGMPSERTVRLWVRQDRDGFAARYGEARTIGGTASAGLTRYSEEVAQRILDQVMDGRLLIDICDEPGMPAARTVRQWAATDRDGFSLRYDRARQLGADALSEEIIVIADDSSNDWILQQRKDGTVYVVFNRENVGRSLLRMKARRWREDRLLPKSRGNRPGARRDDDPDNPAGWAALLKAVDGKSRGLPNKRKKDDEDRGGGSGNGAAGGG